MPQFSSKFNRSVILAACTASAWMSLPDAQAAETRVGRYSVMRLEPTPAQRDPLAMPVLAALPATVTDVGEAIRSLLTPSGYRLANKAASHPAQAALLALPLPDSHRQLAPLPLRTALQVLMGPAFHLVVDPIHRLIAFEPCDPAELDD